MGKRLIYDDGRYMKTPPEKKAKKTDNTIYRDIPEGFGVPFMEDRFKQPKRNGKLLNYEFFDTIKLIYNDGVDKITMQHHIDEMLINYRVRNIDMESIKEKYNDRAETKAPIVTRFLRDDIFLRGAFDQAIDGRTPGYGYGSLPYFVILLVPFIDQYSIDGRINTSKSISNFIEATTFGTLLHSELDGIFDNLRPNSTIRRGESIVEYDIGRIFLFKSNQYDIGSEGIAYAEPINFKVLEVPDLEFMTNDLATTIAYYISSTLMNRCVIMYDTEYNSKYSREYKEFYKQILKSIRMIKNLYPMQLTIMTTRSHSISIDPGYEDYKNMAIDTDKEIRNLALENLLPRKSIVML